MKCPACDNELPTGSIFCMYCGERAIKSRKKREAKKEVNVPKARQLSSGKWTIWLDKEKASVTEVTEARCVAKAKAIRAGFVEHVKNEDIITLEQACKDYIKKRSATCSPSSLRGYDQIVNNRFRKYMPMDIKEIDYQRMINEETSAGSVKAKTIKNAWALVSGSIREAGMTVPIVTLPQVIRNDLPWLDYDEIKRLVSSIEGKPYELEILLVLHGLRRSEAYNVTPKDVVWNADKKRYDIHVEGATVVGRDNKAVSKEENKNSTSRRVVPVMIPRMNKLLAENTTAKDKPYINQNINTLWSHVNRACKEAGVRQVGCHGLRRSWASLSFYTGMDMKTVQMLGGWKDYKTMQDLYVKLSNGQKEAEVAKVTNFFSSDSMKKAGND